MQLTPSGPTLALTEGAEDATAYTRKHRVPAWGLPEIERLAHTAIPGDLDELIIAFDRGSAAASAFEKHADRLRTGGRTLRFDPPRSPSKDWNAELLRHLNEASA